MILNIIRMKVRRESLLCTAQRPGVNHSAAEADISAEAEMYDLRLCTAKFASQRQWRKCIFPASLKWKGIQGGIVLMKSMVQLSHDG